MENINVLAKYMNVCYDKYEMAKSSHFTIICSESREDVPIYRDCCIPLKDASLFYNFSTKTITVSGITRAQKYLCINKGTDNWGFDKTDDLTVSPQDEKEIREKYYVQDSDFYIKKPNWFMRFFIKAQEVKKLKEEKYELREVVCEERWTIQVSGTFTLKEVK